MTLLRANGPIEPGFNPPTVVGAVPLGDQSNTTYVEFPQGGYSTTVGLDTPGVGVTVEAPIALHLIVQVFASDFTGLTMTGEVFLNSEADGGADTEFAGFSDGSGSGFAFAVPGAAYAGPVELVVPLNLSPWAPTTVADVTAALTAGCFLDFNAWTWLTGDSPPTVRVFEAWVVAGGEVVVVPRVLRRYPRDDAHGFGNVSRTYPAPRRLRKYGQQP